MSLLDGLPHVKIPVDKETDGGECVRWECGSDAVSKMSIGEVAHNRRVARAHEERTRFQSDELEDGISVGGGVEDGRRVGDHGRIDVWREWSGGEIQHARHTEPRAGVMLNECVAVRSKERVSCIRPKFRTSKCGCLGRV
jgi:hypothetical protein